MQTWSTFAHQSGPYIMGHNGQKMQMIDLEVTESSWKFYDSYWSEHGKIAYDLAKVIHQEGGRNIELNIALRGKVETTCDRCLDALWVDIDVEESLYIKFGKSYSEESDDLIIIPEDEGTFNIAWTLYEFCALAIPICHSHPDGECNAEMMNIHNQHSVREIDDDDDSDDDIKTTENDEVDPRWAALKNIFNN